MGCKSGAAISDGNGGYACATPDVSISLPTKCLPGSKCSSKTGQYSQPCVCGNNPTGTSYCPLFAGDPQVQSALSASVSVLSNNSICNTFSRFSLNCFANEPELSNFLQFALNFTLIYNGYYPLVQKSLACVNLTLNSNYYALVNAYQSLNIKTCPSYSCTSYYSYWEPNQCVLTRDDILNGVITTIQYSRDCPTGYYCNTTSFALSNASCVPLLSALGYPGDYCKFEFQCYSNRCQDNFCLGIREGELCKNPYDCMPSFFCNQTSFICQALKRKAQSCNFTYECSNSLLCNLGSCINYFSLLNLQYTSIYNNGLSEACMSGFAISIGPTLYVCTNPPVSSRINTCKNIGDKCYDSTGKNARDCQCSIGSSSTLNCPSFEGDSYLQNAIVNLNSLLA